MSTKSIKLKNIKHEISNEEKISCQKLNGKQENILAES